MSELFQPVILCNSPSIDDDSGTPTAGTLLITWYTGTFFIKTNPDAIHSNK
jgi:hypothetical protein